MRQGLCSYPAQLVSALYFAPRSKALGTTKGAGIMCGSVGSRGYVGTGPTSTPLLVWSPALEHWGPPRQQGLCSHRYHLWANFYFVPRFEALATPQAAGVMQPPGPLVGQC